MPRLFYKIFLWFWLGVVAVGGTLFALTEISRSRADDDRKWREKYGPRVDLWARQEVSVLRDEGVVALKKYVNSIQIDPGNQNYIFDADGREVLGRNTPPAYILQIVQSMLKTQRHDLQQEIFQAERVIAETVTGSDGRTFVAIVDFPEPSLMSLSLFEFFITGVHEGAGVRVLGVLIVAGIACFWLARQLVRPIEQLQFAARAIQNERLHTRIDPALLARHDELADLGRDFDRMAERIEHVITAHRNLLADASHALRSPLARINVALGLARRDSSAGSADFHFARIEHETSRLNTLIGDLLLISRLDSGVDLERMVPFDLTLLVDEVAADADYEARGRQCTVRSTTPRECLVVGARETLRAAIENVARNAVRHTAAGSTVDITLTGPRAEEGVFFATIQVRDQGPGVPHQALSRLFTPFYRVTDGRQPAFEGSGLGLAITRRIVEIHRGDVRADNAKDAGLVVTITLPLDPTRISQPAKRSLEDETVLSAQMGQPDEYGRIDRLGRMELES